MKVPLNLILDPHAKIRPDLYKDLGGLVDSMEEIGLKYPIHVHLKDGMYTVCEGTRRLEAAKILGWSEIDVLLVR